MTSIRKILTNSKFIYALYLIPFLIPVIVKSDYYIGILILTIINITLVLSVNIIQGYAGKVSLCQAAFYGMGAYTTSILTTQFGWTFWTALIPAALLPAFVAVLVGWPVLKLKGYYLAIATMGFQAIVSIIFLNWISVTNGPFGIKGIAAPSPIFGVSFESKMAYYYLYLGILLALFAFSKSLLNSRYGRIFLAIKNDELASEAFAINATYYRVFAFALSASIAGIAGSMFAHYFRYVSPASFGLVKSIDAIAMLIIGGSGTLWGCVTGAVIYTFLPEASRWLQDYRMMFIGLSITLVVLFMPDGIVGSATKAYDRINTGKKVRHDV